MTRRALASLSVASLAALLVVSLAKPAVAEPGAAAPLPEAATPAAAADEDEVLPFKLSLPTEDDRNAWKSQGLRLQLGGGYGLVHGLEGAPSGRLITAIVRVGARLDADWSLLASFQYGSAWETGGLNGLRFAGTLDPTWHFTDSLEAAIGFGFGGLVEGRNTRQDVDPAQRETLGATYTLPKPSPTLGYCVGSGPTALVRLGWTGVIGPVASTTFALELNTQWTGCVDDLNEVEADTAQNIERRQWLPHVGGTLAWLVGWR